jgi:ribonuclease HI
MRAGDAERLIGLETAMWLADTRGDRTWMDEHLSPSFTEFGRSGRSYTRDEILDQHVTEIEIEMPLSHLDVRRLGTNIALVTYRTIEPRGHSHRASVWRRADRRSGWQLEFHQGTPTAP